MLQGDKRTPMCSERIRHFVHIICPWAHRACCWMLGSLAAGPRSATAAAFPQLWVAVRSLQIGYYPVTNCELQVVNCSIALRGAAPRDRHELRQLQQWCLSYSVHTYQQWSGEGGDGDDIFTKLSSCTTIYTNNQKIIAKYDNSIIR